MIIFIVLLIILAWVVYKWSRISYDAEKYLPPIYPGKLPLIGHAHLLIGDGQHLWHTIQDIEKYCVKQGGVIQVLLGTQIFYIITDPDDYLTVSNLCIEKNYFYRNILSAWVGEGLVTASVPVWKKHIKLLSPAFRQQILEGYIGVHNDQAKDLVDSLASLCGKGPFKPKRYLERSSLKTNFLTTFGIALDDKNKQLMETYMKAIEELTGILTQRIQTFWMQQPYLYSFTDLKRREEKAIKITRSLSRTIIKQKREVTENQADVINTAHKNSRVKGFMDLLLEKSEIGLLTDQEIQEEVDTLIFAGYETTSNTLTHALVLIGSYPDVQEKIYAELQDVFNGTYRDVEKTDLPRLVYLEAVIKEVSRLYASAPVITRYVEEDVKLKNYTMKAGSNCALMFHAIHRDRMWGNDSEGFRPERWLDPATLPANPNHYIGFGAGRRACIGKPYAMMLMKVTLVNILRRYKITADYRRLKMSLEVILKPIEGHEIVIEPRAGVFHLS